METVDGRGLSREALHERHRLILRAFKRGLSKAEISRQLGVSYPAVCTTIWRYEREGAATLAPKQRGRRDGTGRRLSDQQSSHVRRLICEKRPEQMKMDFALWSRAAVMELIERECGIVLSVRAVGDYLARWGFSPQKPIKRAYEQSAPAVKAWMEETYPAIAKRAKAEDAEIHWGDETAVVIEQLGQRVSAPTVKQHLAAIRRLFDFLVIGQVLPTNPAASVRGPRHVVTEGKTPILEAEEVRTLFAQFDADRLIDLRDRAILGAMVYSFARVGAVAKLRVKDYYRQGVRAWFVLDEKGGKQNRVPAHHQAAEYLEQYLARAGIEAQRELALFRSLGRGRGGQAVTERGLRREEIFAMVRRRTAAVGLPPEIGCHSFRGTGITNYLKNGGTIETAAKLAGHASTRTTQLYDRRLAEVAQAEVERIRF